MKISTFLAPAQVMIDVAATDKEQLLTELSRKAGPIVDVLPDLLFAELRKREEFGSTGMGGGVAIPHARFAQLHKPFALFVRLKRPIDFDAVDGKPVDIVFLLLLPGTPAGEHLGALASMARKLHDPAIAASLRSARDGREMYRTLTAD